MSNTPRTDDRIVVVTMLQSHPKMEMVNAPFVRQLERELNAANQRIKRLEEAGDALRQAALGCCDECMDHIGLHSVGWAKAKETKP